MLSMCLLRTAFCSSKSAVCFFSCRSSCSRICKFTRKVPYQEQHIRNSIRTRSGRCRNWHWAASYSEIFFIKRREINVNSLKQQFQNFEVQKFKFYAFFTLIISNGTIRNQNTKRFRYKRQCKWSGYPVGPVPYPNVPGLIRKMTNKISLIILDSLMIWSNHSPCCVRGTPLWIWEFFPLLAL